MPRHDNNRNFRSLTVPFSDPDQVDDATEVYGDRLTIPVARLVDIAPQRIPSGRAPWHIVEGFHDTVAILDADGDTVIACCTLPIAEQIITAVNGSAAAYRDDDEQAGRS